MKRIKQMSIRRVVGLCTTFENTKNLNLKVFWVCQIRAIAGTRGPLYIVWVEESTTGSNLAIRRSNDAGVTFSDLINLTKNSDNSSHPAISIYDNKSYVV